MKNISLPNYLREIDESFWGKFSEGIYTINEVQVMTGALDVHAEKLGMSEKELKERLEIFIVNGIVKIRKVKIIKKNFGGRRAKRGKWIIVEKDVIVVRKNYWSSN